MLAVSTAARDGSDSMERRMSDLRTYHDRLVHARDRAQEHMWRAPSGRAFLTRQRRWLSLRHACHAVWFDLERDLYTEAVARSL
jgi:hypothetical protein